MFLAALLPASAVAAQTAPPSQDAPRTTPGLAIGAPAPAATQTPVPVPTEAVRGLSLPAPAATPAVAPPPAARRTPATKADRVVAPADTMAPPLPSPEPTPAVQPTSAPSPAAGIAHPAPGAVSGATPPSAAAPAASTAAAAPAVDAAPLPWGWIAGPLIALLALAGWLLSRRGRSRDAGDATIASAPASVVDPVRVPTPMPVTTPVALASLAARPRANVEIALQPSRAGLNMLSAVVEAVVVVANRGDAPAVDVQIRPTLLSAHAGQEADLATAFAAPAGRPAVPPFTLAPGEERRVRIVAALPREAVRSMDAGGRPMFVPLLAVDLRYAADAAGSPGRTGRAFVVGIERVDSAKLAPFWLDGPLRMHDQIAVRPHGAVILD